MTQISDANFPMEKIAVSSACTVNSVSGGFSKIKNVFFVASRPKSRKKHELGRVFPSIDYRKIII